MRSRFPALTTIAYPLGVDLIRGSDVQRVRQLFDIEYLGFVLDAVIAGNTPARVWTDDPEAPASALIWDDSHTVYLAGSIDHPERWRRLFDQEVAAARPGLVKLYIPDAAAGTVFAGHRLQRRQRVLYRLGEQRIPDRSRRLPDGFSISPINDRFAELSRLGNFGEVVSEIESCWESIGDFRHRGFGYVAHDATSIACWCTAEYVSDRHCGTGIETVPAYRGRGLATLTADAFAEAAAGRGLTAYWDAWTDNLPSIAVAEKVGFRRVATYSIFVGSFG
jgi:RimJ/RimL family protein N-acetyltransferase